MVNGIVHAANELNVIGIAKDIGQQLTQLFFEKSRSILSTD